MHSNLLNLTMFLNDRPETKLLIAKMQQSHDDFWLVGGCLRNTLLNLPQVDIDIACSADPTALAKSLSVEASGHWFWLDAKRRQSRVLLGRGLSCDFAPLRAATIEEDLKLRDFTINAFALPIDNHYPDSGLIDLFNGKLHLEKKELHCCSDRSFSDDPLRILKGIRHAVNLGFELSSETLQHIVAKKQMLTRVAGERIRDELCKICNSVNAFKGIELLIGTSLLPVLFNGNEILDRNAAIVKFSQLDFSKLDGLEIVQKNDSFSLRGLFLLSLLIKISNPDSIPEVLQHRLRLSRWQQKLMIELQPDPDMDVVTMVLKTTGVRRQALLAEKMGSFFFEKILYWDLCYSFDLFDIAIEMDKSFKQEQSHGRIIALLNSHEIYSLLGNDQQAQIGRWQEDLKLAEIKGQISNSFEAEKWLKNKLSFDKNET